MKAKFIIISVYCLFAPMLIWAQTNDTLMIYGPGGPAAAMKECAGLYTQKYSTPIKIIAGPEGKWINDAYKNADIIFGGAEYMLTQFDKNHPGLINNATRTELYKRAAGILVRPGNPQKIHSLKDLTLPGVKILEVIGAGQLGMWEDLAGKQNIIGDIQKNIKGAAANTALAIDMWKKDDRFDAIIIFSSWYYRLKDVASLVTIPPSQTVYRGTPIAITSITKQKQNAAHFIQFLLSEEGHNVFKKWGWE
ncbi:MAG: hypothetical protein EKK39_11265 [Sphingobacteriales bacterium]|uniref:substrate-binding domain-containing protein n=1 Tax=Hydrotalea flava TaxID=714549 RepID=UPI00082D8BA5|nr:substrate-binding domain-containing protein [Hydrotalea flava]RTL49312.1 MAG: hypothetical protein EKK39_11265 [Sphingobacteriales bacterium]